MIGSYCRLLVMQLLNMLNDLLLIYQQPGVPAPRNQDEPKQLACNRLGYQHHDDEGEQ